MAYRLKTVRYQDSDRKILLQNENGPCPLLAAANALLLRGTISLPPACIRNGVASLNDVVNVLAERAFARAGDDHQHHLDELMTIFPNLQYGMDVNPKFTGGPTGVEYTSGLTAFDMLNVELVHGWLLDPQDEATHSVVGMKTYNELVEFVVQGSEASLEVDRIGVSISVKDQELKTLLADIAVEEEGWVNVEDTAPLIEDDATPALQSERTVATIFAKERKEVEKVIGKTHVEMTAATTDFVAEKSFLASTPEDTSQDTVSPVSTLDRKAAIEKELDELCTTHKELSARATNAVLVNTFLSSSAHQLTHYGLHELYNYLAEESLCVFFRNNHFATLTKKNGVLYLLVTDLGYASVPDVMWEKLDGIDGDTEYVNALFVKPAPQTDLLPGAGVALSPEQMLAQRGQSEADYQLALELSRHSGAKSRANLDEAEGKLMAAATEASLRTYNGVSDDESKFKGTPEVAQGDSVVTSSGLVDGCTTQEDSDKLIALQMQSQEEASMKLARKLQDEAFAEMRVRSPNTSRAPTRSSTGSGSSSTSSGCIIS